MQIRPISQTFAPTGFFATGYKVYIGNSFTNPLQSQNQVVIYDADSTTDPQATISQPLIIGRNGEFQNNNSQTVNPDITGNSYSIAVVSPDGGVLAQYANVQSDVISGTGTDTNIVDQVIDYLSLAQTSDLSDYDHIYIRSELDNPTDPTDGGYYVKDGTASTPSTGDINKFYDSEGNGWLREHDQRFSEDLDVIENRNYEYKALVRGTRGTLTTRWENDSGAEAVGDLTSGDWRQQDQFWRIGGTSASGDRIAINFDGLGSADASLCVVKPTGSVNYIAFGSTDGAGELTGYNFFAGSAMVQSSTQAFTWNASPVMCSIGGENLAIINDTVLQTYDYDGFSFSTVGNSLAIPTGSTTAIALAQNRIAVSTDANFYVYDFDGTDWTQVGTAFAISDFGFVGVLQGNYVVCGEVNSSGFSDTTIYEYDEAGDTWNFIYQDTDLNPTLVINETTILGSSAAGSVAQVWNGDSLDTYNVNVNPLNGLLGAPKSSEMMSNGLVAQITTIGDGNYYLGAFIIHGGFYSEPPILGIING